MSGERAFTKRQRLLVRADFDRVFQAAAKIRSQYLTLFVRTSSVPCPRLGVVVAKKNVSRAVDRNRIKRAIRETFRHHLEDLPKEVVVVAHKGSGQLSTKELRDILEKEWLKTISKQGGSSFPPFVKGE